MSALFEADDYLRPGARPRSARKPPPTTPTMRTRDDQWVLIVTVSKGVLDGAHRVYKVGKFGETITRCERAGRAVPVAEGAEIVPCKVCQRWAP